MYPEGANSKKGPNLNSSSSAKSGVSARQIVGLVVFDGEKFLLLHRLLHWKGWEFPKGHVKDNESVDSAMARELLEETGIPKFELIGKIDEIDHFDNARKQRSFVQNFLVRVSSNNKITFEHQSFKDGVRVREHDDFKWCFPAEAVKMLKHRNMKQSMQKAIKMLGLEMGK